MATYTFNKIDYGGNTYVVSDSGALQLTGGQVTGPVTFGDSISVDEATLGNLVVNGSGSFTNNLQVNTINGVAVGSNPKFTDNNTTYSAGTGLSLSSNAFSVKLGYTTSGNNRAVQADSNGNLYVTQKDDNSGGTVTKVTAGTGLSIGSTAGGNFTTTGTINHTNSVTAQTTQAVYPIKIDAQGHISAYGSAQTILSIGTGASNAAAGNHTHSYLPLSGGTLTGRLTTADPINQLITGSGTAATTSGSNYVPAKWTFNTGQNASNGDIVTIKIPVAGHDYGVFMSVNNGTNYYPIVVGNGTGRLTTHFQNATPIMLVFDSSGSADSIYPLAGGTARTTVSGGVWRVVNYYNSTYYYESCYVTTAAGTAAKVGTLSNYALQKGHLQVAIYNANTYAGAITLNINGTGAKPIYINGSASSASNHTLPKGMYLVYYDGTNYYFRTDGHLQSANGVLTSKTGTVTSITLTQGDGISIDSSGTAITTSGSRTIALSTSGATAGSYGPSANASPSAGGTFSVPYITIDKYGRVTASSTKTVTLPANHYYTAPSQLTATWPSTATGSMIFRKWGAVVSCQLTQLSKLPAGSTQIYTDANPIPAKYRPGGAAARVFLSVGGTVSLIQLIVYTSGKVEIYNYGTAVATETNYRCCLTYISDTIE